MPVTSTVVHGPLFLKPGASWFFWYYPHGGAYQTGTTIDKDLTTMSFVPRPFSPDHWEISNQGIIVVLEVTPGTGGTDQFRHSYRVLVKNSGTKERAFYIAAAESRP
jgi:hypothetical protein